MERKAVSGIMLTLILTSMLILAFNIQHVKAQETIISSVSPITATNLQTINIYGSGFGNTPPQTVDVGDGSVNTVKSDSTPYMYISDRGKFFKTDDPSGGGQNWMAGLAGPDIFCAIGIYLVSWSDNEIVLGGFGTALGVNGQGQWYIEPGDPLAIHVVTPSGRALYHTTVEGGPLAYDVTINAYCNTEGAYVSVPISLDGSPTGLNTPQTFIGLTGTHTFAVPSTDANGHPFSRWSTGQTSTTITVSYGGTYTVGYYQDPPPPPVITSVSPIVATNLQTIHIYGSGFGNTWPQTVDAGDGSVDTVRSVVTPYVDICDLGDGDPSHIGKIWAAGIRGPGVFCAIGIYLVSWSDNEIVLGGFGTALGTNPQDYWHYIEPGDALVINVYTPSGQATYHTTVAGAPPPPVYGKGIWIWHVWETEGGDLDTIIGNLTFAKVKWVAIKLGDGDSYWLREIPDLVEWAKNYGGFSKVIERFHDKGIRVLGAHFVYGRDRWEIPDVSEVDVSEDILSIVDIDGLLIDVEPDMDPQWALDKWGNYKQRLIDYLESIRASYANSFIAYTSYARSGDWKGELHELFTQYCDVSMPQAYWAARPQKPEEEIVEMEANLGVLYDKWHKKPIIPMGQGGKLEIGRDVYAGEIKEFCDLLFGKGYLGVSLFRYEIISNPGWGEYSGCFNSDITFPAYSPVDLIVTDPDGLIISKALNEIAGATYREFDLDGDGDPDDVVSILHRKLGNYSIEVTQEPGAAPTDTFTLEVSTRTGTTVLAENVAISEIPSEPYIFESTAPPPVGGVVISVDKPALLIPWIVLAALVTVAAVSVAVCSKKWRRKDFT